MIPGIPLQKMFGQVVDIVSHPRFPAQGGTHIDSDGHLISDFADRLFESLVQAKLFLTL